MPILGVVHGTKIGPNAPTITSVTDVGLNREFDNGAVDVAFTPAAINTAVSYRVTSSNGRTATGTTSPIRVQNLPTGINTTFTITGINSITIEGQPSAVSTGVTVTTVPFKPVVGVATAGDGQAFVVFTLANSGGKQVISYLVTGSPAGTATDTGSPITVPNLNNGTPHAFTVIAINANGSSIASNPSNTVVPSASQTELPPTTTYYCYSSDCFTQDGINYAYLQAPVFTTVSSSDQSSLSNYSAGFGSARGTLVTYCNTVENTARIGAQQPACQANYVEPDPPPPCDPVEYTTACGPYTAGPQVAGCSPTSADYGYTITETATRTRTIYDCNGVITSISVLECTRSTFTSVTSNDPRCPGYRQQTTTTQVSGGISSNAAVSGGTTSSSSGTTAVAGTNSSTQGTAVTTANQGTLVRDPAGAGYQDPATGQQTATWYSRVEPDGSTTLFLLPETTPGQPDTSNLTVYGEGIPIPAGGFNLDFSGGDWTGLGGTGSWDSYGPMFTAEELAAIDAYVAEQNAATAQPSTPAADTTSTTTNNDTTITTPFDTGTGSTNPPASAGGNAPPADPPPAYGGKSINIFTLVRTANGLVPAWELKVGDKLLSADIDTFPYDNLLTTDMELIDWDAQNPQINIVETEIVSLRTRIAKWAIMVDSDMFSDSHYILVKRNDVTKFVKAIDLESTDLIWSISNQNWVSIGLLRKVEVNHEVLSIDCEPYDIFFTERMLTHDSSTVD
jgi:hypothetical protein